MRLHNGGYGHGVNWATLGFILEVHPVFTDVNDLRTTLLMSKIAKAWANNSDIFTVEKKSDIAHTVNPNSNLPFTPYDASLHSASKLVHSRLTHDGPGV